MSAVPADGTVEHVRKLAEDWATAELTGDDVELGKMLADNFAGVGPRGFILTKTQWIQRIQSGLKYQALHLHEIDVHPYENAALAP